MTEEDIIQLQQKFAPENIKENISFTRNLALILGDQFQSLHDNKIKVESWEYYLETLIQKIIFHSLSIYNLSEGLILSSQKYNKIVCRDKKEYKQNI